MVRLTKAQIVESIVHLDEHERAEIGKWCEALGARDLSPSQNADAEQAYSALCDCFRQYYRTSHPASLYAFSRSHPVQYRHLLRATGKALARIDDWWPHSRRNVRRAILAELCRLTFDVCTRRSVRVGWRLVTDALAEIETTVNDAFPGWLRAGIFQQRFLSRILGASSADPERPRSRVSAHVK